MTFFTLVKGFVCGGILYLPKNYYNGGYLFSPIAIILSCIITSVCILKLLKAREACKARSFEDIGNKAYGKFGKNLVGVYLVLS
jgi:amino acid permease